MASLWVYRQADNKNEFLISFVFYCQLKWTVNPILAQEFLSSSSVLLRPPPPSSSVLLCPPPLSSVTLMVPLLDFKNRWTGELWLKTKGHLFSWKEKKMIKNFWLKFFLRIFLWLSKVFDIQPPAGHLPNSQAFLEKEFIPIYLQYSWATFTIFICHDFLAYWYEKLT